MSEFAIRFAKPDDDRAINALVGECRATSYLDPSYGLDEEWAVQIRADLLSPEAVDECRRDVIRANNDPARSLYLVVGGLTVTAVFYAEKRRGVQEIHRFFVAEGSRNRELGSDMLSIYNKWRSLQLPDTVTVVPYNFGAVRLYGRHSYKRVPDSEHTYPDNVPTIRMERPVGVY